MTSINSAKRIWINALKDLLDSKLDDNIIEVLAQQTLDSIRRIKIYELYAERAKDAERLNKSYYDTNNPFTLAQRESLNINSRVWFIYLATYFGKNDTSKWKLFNRSAFDDCHELITSENILLNRNQYYDSLREIDFFEGTKYSNHRKFTKKSLDGNHGVIESMDYFLDHVDEFTLCEQEDFNLIYKKALKIPNFGRMASFDFTCSLCKCSLMVSEPKSMYHKNSTGPLLALKHLMSLAGIKTSKNTDLIIFGDNLLSWFDSNTNIYMLAQVLEDAICNWQKAPKSYKKYFG